MTGEDYAVSVVMPVRNAMPFLDEAVASILAQTYCHFELVIGDDASTDGSGERLREWARRDSRIHLIQNSGRRLGPSGSANWVARAARYPLVARMDADDISMPDRLRRQVLAFQENADAVLAGSLFDCIDFKGNRVLSRNRSVLMNPRCVFPVAHGSIMFRRDAFERVGGYRPQCDYWEDVDLFIRMEREGRILILPEAHYRYRFSPTSSRLVSNEARVARAADLCLRCIDAHLNGRDYEVLLLEEAYAASRVKVAPKAIMCAVMGRLWSGDPQSMFSWGRRHASFGWNRPSAVVLTFASWAWIHSASLRAYFRFRTILADWRARHAVTDGLVYTWRPRRPEFASPVSRRSERLNHAGLTEDRPSYIALSNSDTFPGRQ